MTILQGKVSKERRKEFVPCPKRMKKALSFSSQRYYFSSQFSNRHVVCNFDNPIDKFATWPKFFRSLSEIDKQNILLQKDWFSPNWSFGQLEHRFDKPRKKIDNILLVFLHNLIVFLLMLIKKIMSAKIIFPSE